MSTDISELLKVKSKSNTSKKKTSKKQKTVKNISKNATFHKSDIKAKAKELELTIKYDDIANVVKNKKVSKVTTEMSPYFYSINNTKYKIAKESVKPYLKFVKNITITYPVMIPARENVKSRDSFKKSQKQKEKSRDLNSNRNVKILSSKPVEVTTFVKPSTKNTKENITGN